MPRSRFSTATSVACTLLTSLAVAPLSKAEETVVMSFPRFDAEATHRVVAIDGAQRALRIAATDERSFFNVSEGPALLIVPGQEGAPPDTAVRVEVTEVLDDGSVRATFGPAAAAVVRAGPALLGRPFTGDLAGGPPKAAPTKAIRGLPDVVRPLREDARAAGAVSQAGAVKARLESTTNLKQLGLAFHNYADTMGAFPPAVVVGPDGQPWHSWRVILLPYLEDGAEIYRQYDFSQPWDSPKNLAVAAKMPKVYRDPARKGPADGVTDYAALVGDRTIFPLDLVRMKDADDFPACLSHGEKISFPQVTDGTSNTIMFVTADPARKIPWTKPEDIHFDDDFPGIGKPGGIGAIHPGSDGKAGLAVFTDGSAQVIDEHVSEEIVAALVTRDGGEVVDRSSLSGVRESPRMGGVPQVRIIATDDGSLRLQVD